MITVYAIKDCTRCSKLFEKLLVMNTGEELEYRLFPGSIDKLTSSEIQTFCIADNNGAFPVIEMGGVLLTEVQLMVILERMRHEVSTL